jgi:TatD family-associated radical SAM protein
MVQNRKPSTVYWLDNTLYLNITNQCSNSCYFCLKRYKRGVGGFDLILEAEPSITQIIADLTEVLHRQIWDEMVFCGFGEPTERLDVLLEVAKYVKNIKLWQTSANAFGHEWAWLHVESVVSVGAELKVAGVDELKQA